MKRQSIDDESARRLLHLWEAIVVVDEDQEFIGPRDTAMVKEALVRRAIAARWVIEQLYEALASDKFRLPPHTYPPTPD